MDVPKRVKESAGPVILGVLGSLFFVVCLHLWRDHQALHQIFDAIAKQVTAQQQQRLAPTPAPQAAPQPEPPK